MKKIEIKMVRASDYKVGDVVSCTEDGKSMCVYLGDKFNKDEDFTFFPIHENKMFFPVGKRLAKRYGIPATCFMMSKMHKGEDNPIMYVPKIVEG